jgi:hypothetical protein
MTLSSRIYDRPVTRGVCFVISSGFSSRGRCLPSNRTSLTDQKSGHVDAIPRERGARGLKVNFTKHLTEKAVRSTKQFG